MRSHSHECMSTTKRNVQMHAEHTYSGAKLVHISAAENVEIPMNARTIMKKKLHTACRKVPRTLRCFSSGTGKAVDKNRMNVLVIRTGMHAA
jgi:hypothetical protein